jgi:hypothetical protein
MRATHLATTRSDFDGYDLIKWRGILCYDHRRSLAIQQPSDIAPNLSTDAPASPNPRRAITDEHSILAPGARFLTVIATTQRETGNEHSPRLLTNYSGARIDRPHSAADDESQRGIPKTPAHQFPITSTHSFLVSFQSLGWPD